MIYRKTCIYSTCTFISSVNIFTYFSVWSYVTVRPVFRWITFDFLAVLALCCHRKYSRPTCHPDVRGCTAEICYCSVLAAGRWFIRMIREILIQFSSKTLLEKFKNTLIEGNWAVSEYIRIVVSTVRALRLFSAQKSDFNMKLRTNQIRLGIREVCEFLVLFLVRSAILTLKIIVRKFDWNSWIL